MKTILLFLSLTLSLNTYAASTCKALQKLQESGAELEVLRKGDVLNKDNWKSIDVILSFNRNECLESTSQQLVRVNGELVWRFASTEDSCDGGNTYGSFYSYDLKTPVAHIYDGEIYCEDDWREEERSENHKCDLAAEALAEKKMKEFGLDFKSLESSLKLKTSHSYSEILVKGSIESKNVESAYVKVLTDLETCKFVRAEIDSIPL